MGDESRRPEGQEPSRRFRISRKVAPGAPAQKPEAPAGQAPEEDALPGSREMNAEVDRGCSGCLRLTLLLLAIMFASIIGTCAINRR